MKRIISIFIFCTLISQLSMAQITNGSLAPNITGVDIYGNSYDLYNILGSGRGVIIDFSTTWCGPCYTMHINHFFDRINRNYGPQGTDEVVVLLLEADNTTTLADLQGTGNFTVGDFTACTDIPILDNMSSASSNYQVAGYPTFFVINPDDSTTQSFQIFNHHTMLAYMVGIGMINQPQLDAGIDYLCDENKTKYICSEANSFVPKFEIFNFGVSPLTSLNFDIYINGVYHSSQNWAGNLLSFEGEELVLSPIPITSTSDVTLVIDQPGGGNAVNDTLSLNVVLSPATTNNQVTVEIQTDHLGAETYWHISDNAGNIIASGGNSWVGTTNIGIGFGATSPQTPPGSYQSNQTYTHNITLGTDSCYDFVITDYYGGGIRKALGGYTVYDHSGNVLFSGSEFESIVSHPFLNTSVTSVDEKLTDTNIQLYPNPASDLLHLSVNFTQADISILDLQGRQLYQSAWSQKPISISHLSKGLYILKISSGGNIWTKRFVKE